MSAMLLLNLKSDQHTLNDTDGWSERPKYLEHHDLLVDVLWEELEDTVRELLALAVSTDQRTC